MRAVYCGKAYTEERVDEILDAVQQIDPAFALDLEGQIIFEGEESD